MKKRDAVSALSFPEYDAAKLALTVAVLPVFLADVLRKPETASMRDNYVREQVSKQTHLMVEAMMLELYAERLEARPEERVDLAAESKGG